MSYRPMMEFKERQRDGSHYAGNGLRFATKEEAEDQAKDLMSRWLVPCGYRIDLSPDRPNYKWDSASQKSVYISEEEK